MTNMSYDVAKNPTLIWRPEQVKSVIDSLFAVDVFALDVETTSLVKHDAKLHGIALATDDQEWYVTAEAVDAFMGYCQPLFDAKVVVMHNHSYDVPFFLWRGVSFARIFDTMIAQWVIDSTQDIGLKSLAVNKLNAPYDFPDFGEMQHEAKRLQSIFKGRPPKVSSMTMLDVPLRVSAAYAMRDGRYTIDLYHLSVAELEKLGLTKIYQEHIVPMSEVLLDMEMRGMGVDLQVLNDLDAEYTETLKILDAQWIDAVGNINYNSTIQLPYLLYGYWDNKKGEEPDPEHYIYGPLNLKTDRVTKAGKPSTDKLSLLRLRTELRLAPPVLDDNDVVPMVYQLQQWWFGGYITPEAQAKEFKRLRKLYDPEVSGWNSAPHWDDILVAYGVLLNGVDLPEDTPERQRKIIANLLQDDVHPVPEKKLYDCHSVHPLRILHSIKEYAKLHKTYIKGGLYSIRDGRIFSNFNQTGTKTGRLSSSGSYDNNHIKVGLNLQNIPSRGTGAKIKTAFSAPPGRSLLVIDYSQLELRILAHYAARFAQIVNRNNNVSVDPNVLPPITISSLQEKTGEELLTYLRQHTDIFNEMCINAAQAKSLWRTLVSKLHPDTSGFDSNDAFVFFRNLYDTWEEPVTSRKKNKAIQTHLLNVFLIGGDPHQMTADKAGIARTYAKRVNFGWAYGVGPKALCDQIEEATGVRPSMAEAKLWLKGFAKAYPECIIWKKAVLERAREYGFVRTIAGRILWLHNINSQVQSDRAQDERRAVNYIIQGSAADVMNYAMVQIKQFLDAFYPECFLIGQVHDEVVIEGPTEVLQNIEDALKDIMRQAGEFFELLIDLDVDGSVGPNWYEAK